MSEISKSPAVQNTSGVGYYVSKEERKEDIYQNESHIHKQNPIVNFNTEARKYPYDLFVYFPKGFKGSINSDFHEYLSLGKIPYLIGSLMLIGLYKGAKNIYNSKSAFAAGNIEKRMGAGVVLYAAGKLLSTKLAHAAIKHSTGVDLDMKYTNIIKELPEDGHQSITAVQYPGVFDSADFPRKDLIALDNRLNHGDKNLNHGDIYYYEDKIAKKMGYKDRLNAPNQVVWPKIRELKVRTTALENVSKYIAAATGVALGSQKAFEELSWSKFKFNKTKVSQALKRETEKCKDASSEKGFFAGILDNLKALPAKLNPVNIKNSIVSEKNNYMPKEDLPKVDFGQIKNAKGISDKLKASKDQFKILKDNISNSFNKTYLGAVRRVIRERLDNKESGIIQNVFGTLKKAFKQLWNGTDRNAITKNYGKVLIIGTLVSTALTWLIPTLGFKKHPDNMKSKVDTKKEYEVC